MVKKKLYEVLPTPWIWAFTQRGLAISRVNIHKYLIPLLETDMIEILEKNLNLGEICQLLDHLIDYLRSKMQAHSS